MGKVIDLDDWKLKKRFYHASEKHQGSGLDLIWFDDLRGREDLIKEYWEKNHRLWKKK